MNFRASKRIDVNKSEHSGTSIHFEPGGAERRGRVPHIRHTRALYEKSEDRIGRQARFFLDDVLTGAGGSGPGSVATFAGEAISMVGVDDRPCAAAATTRSADMKQQNRSIEDWLRATLIPGL
jgi:hypothetical protein